ncbi:MAG: DsbA family protein [Bacteroidota bacterium]
MKTASSSPEIIYVGDPMCSWCWGIAGELAQLKARYAGQAGFSVLLGGLRPGGRETNRDLGGFLGHHWHQVTELSGQPISHEILENADFVYDTEPPSRAVRCLRELDSPREYEFFQAIQEAFYVRNRDTNQLETYLELCQKMDIDEEAFAALYLSDEMRKATADDFLRARQLGISSFPTVLLRVNDEYHLVARGYARMASMDREIAETLALV